ncbi:hypothetical protein EV356DRAFT_452728 [Viridothelium virens]|uniref:PD-(D/E)XK nuclease-like domain-containing protein n=1 Tax=Viridothelium virens TaxID=1048519 RepID=A0A6A6GZ87_VIRVR|nr:hypothetical protein EV356DRAFT_452728 [Viridothelium virens]
MDTKHTKCDTLIKQLVFLEDDERPLTVRNFDDDDDDLYGEAPKAVTEMQIALQDFADGIGILGYESNTIPGFNELPRMDRVRMQYAFANNPESRKLLGRTPPIEIIIHLVSTARRLDRGAGERESPWNEFIHLPLLELALATSIHSKALFVAPMKNVEIEPPQLLRANTKLPGSHVDYVIFLNQDEDLKSIWAAMEPMPSSDYKSFHHGLSFRELPVAIGLEATSQMTSWTDAKVQIAIWTDALLERYTWFGHEDDRKSVPLTTDAMPLILVQGHDWRVSILSKKDGKVVIRESILIGSTRNCFDTMKLVAAFHWMMNWAVVKWLPKFKIIAGGPNYGSETSE